MERVVIANDHGGTELKFKIMKHLEKRGYEVVNLGVDDTNSVDYPDIAKKAVLEYRKGGYSFGILICGTGIGISISANKMRGIRCALIHDKFTAEFTKKHNNPNFIAFGGRVKYYEPIEEIIDAFLDNSFEGGRHEIRINKMMNLENE